MLSIVMAHFVRNGWKFLARDEVVIGGAFVYGTAFNEKDKLTYKEVLEAPISNTAYRLFKGSLYSIGATVVSSFMPPHIKPLVPLALVASTVYHATKNEGEK